MTAAQAVDWPAQHYRYRLGPSETVQPTPWIYHLISDTSHKFNIAHAACNVLPKHHIGQRSLGLLIGATDSDSDSFEMASICEYLR